MPSVSGKQHRFFAAVANNPKFAKQAGVPQSVGQDFMQADKGRKFGSGSRADIQSINKPKTEHGKSAILAKGGDVKESKAMMKKEVGFMKKAGAPKSMIKHEESEMKGMKKGGMAKYAMGGGVMEKKGMTTAKMGKVVAGGKRPHGEHTVQQKGHTRGTQIKMAGGGKMGKC